MEERFVTWAVPQTVEAGMDIRAPRVKAATLAGAVGAANLRVAALKSPAWVCWTNIISEKQWLGSE